MPKGSRDITLHSANSTLDATEGTAHVTRTQDVTSAIRDAVISDAEGYRDMYLNVLSDLDDFGITHANSKVTELTSLNTSNGTPWAGQALGKGLAERDYATTLQPINLTNRQTSGNAQVDYTTSEANAWHTRVNAQTEAQVTLQNDRNAAKGNRLSTEQSSIQSGVELGITPVTTNEASFAPTANVITQAPSTVPATATALPGSTAPATGEQTNIRNESPPIAITPYQPLTEEPQSASDDFHQASNIQNAWGSIDPDTFYNTFVLNPDGTISLSHLGFLNGQPNPLGEATDTTQGVLLKVKDTHKRKGELDPETAQADASEFIGLTRGPGNCVAGCHPGGHPPLGELKIRFFV